MKVLLIDEKKYEVVYVHFREKKKKGKITPRPHLLKVITVSIIVGMLRIFSLCVQTSQFIF